MRSKRSKRWHINKDMRRARELIEQGLLPAPNYAVMPGAGPPLYGFSPAIVDEYAIKPLLVRVPK